MFNLEVKLNGEWVVVESHTSEVEAVASGIERLYAGPACEDVRVRPQNNPKNFQLWEIKNEKGEVVDIITGATPQSLKLN